MDSLTDELFMQKYSVMNCLEVPAYMDAESRLSERLEPLKETYGRRFIDEINNLAFDLAIEGEKIAFREGIRFGFQLLRELEME